MAAEFSDAQRKVVQDMIDGQAPAIRLEMGQIIESGQAAMQRTQGKIMEPPAEARQNSQRMSDNVVFVNQTRDSPASKVGELEASIQAVSQKILGHEQVIEHAGLGSYVAHERLNALTEELKT